MGWRGVWFYFTHILHSAVDKRAEFVQCCHQAPTKDCATGGGSGDEGSCIPGCPHNQAENSDQTSIFPWCSLEWPPSPFKIKIWASEKILARERTGTISCICESNEIQTNWILMLFMLWLTYELMSLAACCLRVRPWVLHNKVRRALCASPSHIFPSIPRPYRLLFI